MSAAAATAERDLHGQAFLDDPYPLYERWRAEAPLWWSEGLGGHVVSRYEDVRLVLGDAAGFRQSQAWERGLTDALGTQPLVAQDPPRHDVVRRAFAGPFRPRALEAQMTDVVERVVGDVVGQLDPREPFELNGDVSMRMSMAVVAALIGSEDSPELAGLYATVLDSLRQVRVNRADDDVEAGGRQAGQRLIEHLVELRARGVETVGLDLVRTVPETAELDEREIVTTCANLLVAGVETTVGGVATAVYALLTHADALAAVRADHGLARRAFDEALRWISPVQMVGKQVAAPRAIAGHDFSEGDELILLLGSANRDPARYEQPDRYGFERAHRDHLAFGSGLHLCLGAPLARLEGRVLLTALLEAFPNLALDPDHVAAFGGGPSARALRELWLSPTQSKQAFG